jgi:hypothetical protein
MTGPKLALDDPRVVAAKASLDASGPKVGKERVRRALYAARDSEVPTKSAADMTISELEAEIGRLTWILRLRVCGDPWKPVVIVATSDTAWPNSAEIQARIDAISKIRAGA